VPSVGRGGRNRRRRRLQVTAGVLEVPLAHVLNGGREEQRPRLLLLRPTPRILALSHGSHYLPRGLKEDESERADFHLNELC
jgi:hypothetical protein